MFLFGTISQEHNIRANSFFFTDESQFVLHPAGNPTRILCTSELTESECSEDGSVIVHRSFSNCGLVSAVIAYVNSVTKRDGHALFNFPKIFNFFIMKKLRIQSITKNVFDSMIQNQLLRPCSDYKLIFQICKDNQLLQKL